MDSGRGPLLSLAASPKLSLLRALEARRDPRNGRGSGVEAESQWGGKRVDKAADQAGGMTGIPTRHAISGAGRIIHHILWQHPLSAFLTPLLT